MKLLQDNIVFLIVFFSSLVAATTAIIKLGTLLIKEKSVGKTAIERIETSIKNDREAVDKVLKSLQENNNFIIEKLIEKTKH